MPSSIDLGAIDAAGRHALPLPRLRPRHDSEVRQDGDLIVTVCDLARAGSRPGSRGLCSGHVLAMLRIA
jgi:hypothetical protein